MATANLRLHRNKMKCTACVLGYGHCGNTKSPMKGCQCSCRTLCQIRGCRRKRKGEIETRDGKKWLCNFHILERLNDKASRNTSILSELLNEIETSMNDPEYMNCFNEYLKWVRRGSKKKILHFLAYGDNDEVIMKQKLTDEKRKLASKIRKEKAEQRKQSVLAAKEKDTIQNLLRMVEEIK